LFAIVFVAFVFRFRFFHWFYWSINFAGLIKADWIVSFILLREKGFERDKGVIRLNSFSLYQLFYLLVFIYVPIFITTMNLLLRRTLQGFDRL
jgi:hypothetical protein